MTQSSISIIVLTFVTGEEYGNSVWNENFDQCIERLFKFVSLGFITLSATKLAAFCLFGCN